MTVAVLRGSRGRKAGGRCRKETRGNRRARRCTRFSGVGNLTFNGTRGLNKPRLPGRVGRKRLHVGRYRLIAVANDGAGARSRSKRTGFKIVKR